MRFVAFVIASLTLSVAFCRTPEKGTINGTVVDDQGRPAPGIKVAALPVPGGMAGVVPWVISDSDGKWQIRGLKIAMFLLVTEDQPDGYPNTMSGLYSRSPQMVSLTPDSPSATVVIRLGPKAAVLTGTLRDAVTGAPISNGYFEMWRTDDARRSLRGGSAPAEYKLLLPASTAVSLKFSAPGYQTWYYPGVANATNSTSLTLKSVQQQTMDVQLQPLP